MSLFSFPFYPLHLPVTVEFLWAHLTSSLEKEIVLWHISLEILLIPLLIWLSDMLHAHPSALLLCNVSSATFYRKESGEGRIICESLVQQWLADFLLSILIFFILPIFFSVFSLKSRQFICKVLWVLQLLLQSIFKIWSIFRAKLLNFHLQGISKGFFLFVRKHNLITEILELMKTQGDYIPFELSLFLDANWNFLLVCLCFFFFCVVESLLDHASTVMWWFRILKNIRFVIWDLGCLIVPVGGWVWRYDLVLLWTLLYWND